MVDLLELADRVDDRMVAAAKDALLFGGRIGEPEARISRAAQWATISLALRACASQEKSG